MKNQFVTYEIAKKLKKIGFNEKCFGAFSINKEFSFFYEKGMKELRNSDFGKTVITAPLWQQVIDWLRDKHKLLIVVTHASPKNKYVSIIYKEWNNEVYATLNYPENYSEAREQAILKSLELITT